nr:Chain B, macrocyclic peptide [synthetic construct]
AFLFVIRDRVFRCG